MTTPPDLVSISALCSEPYGFWLDSAMAGERMASRSFCGNDPAVVLRSWGRAVEVWRRGATAHLIGDPFDVLRELLAERREIVGGLAAGYLGYGLKQHIEALPNTAVDDLGLPDCCIAFYDRCLEFESLPAQTPSLGATSCGFDTLASTFTREQYEAAVERALDYIRAGDIYQVNLSQRFESAYPGEPWVTYLALRGVSPAPFAAYLFYPGFAVLSSSPERFLRYAPASRLIETRPIKGTRPRGGTPEEDRRLAEELLASEKDRAENVMIVDLERNDLGRVAATGSVQVTGLWELESFANVHHLTSIVQARLAEGRDIVDLLRATFPGGSITGAPKIRAMEIIDELEPVARGVYTGAIGYIRSDGEMDFNIAIRTMVMKGGRAYFHVGGGIVADSDPGLEYEETLHKGAAMARVVTARTP